MNKTEWNGMNYKTLITMDIQDEATFKAMLIANAPPQPHWFEPTLPPEPEKVEGFYPANLKKHPNYNYIVGDERGDDGRLKYYYNFTDGQWYDPDNLVPDDLKKELNQMREGYEQYVTLYQQWEIDCQHGQYFQWPIYYAEQIIARLTKKEE